MPSCHRLDQWTWMRLLWNFCACIRARELLKPQQQHTHTAHTSYDVLCVRFVSFHYAMRSRLCFCCDSFSLLTNANSSVDQHFYLLHLHTSTCCCSSLEPVQCTHKIIMMISSSRQWKNSSLCDLSLHCCRSSVSDEERIIIKPWSAMNWNGAVVKKSVFCNWTWAWRLTTMSDEWWEWREKWKIFFYFTGLCWNWITSGFTSTLCVDSVTELSDYWHAHSSLELRLNEFRGPLRATKMRNKLGSVWAAVLYCDHWVHFDDLSVYYCDIHFDWLVTQQQLKFFGWS